MPAANADGPTFPSACAPAACVLPAAAQISDFGLSRVVTSTHRTTQTYGTVNHSPPERLKRGFLAAPGDVYAFGIMSEWPATSNSR